MEPFKQHPRPQPAKTRSLLDDSLSQLLESVIHLSSLVVQAINESITALGSGDVALAQAVIDRDREINTLRYEIEQACLRVLATQQPAARDLRAILSALHLAVELERIGDLAAGIARLAQRLEPHAPEIQLHWLPQMARCVTEMIEESVQAYRDLDRSRAKALIERDDEVDQDYNRFFERVMREDMHDEEYVCCGTYLLWVAHNLERIGDRVTNIAERIIFAAEGRFMEVNAA